MAKRSKKKNPNVLSEKKKAEIRHNQLLDAKINTLDNKLNLTIGIVIAVAVITFLLLPAVNMNFSGSLNEFLGGFASDSLDGETIEIAVNMSNLDILFAMTKGYKDSIEYIANSNSSGLGATIIYNAFMTKVTEDDINLLDFAYILSFILSILFLISLVAFLIATCVKRTKKVDCTSFAIVTVIFSILAILQWIVYICVGIASAGKAVIQPHIASYLLLATAVTMCSVYGVYRAKVKKLNSQKIAIDVVDSEVR